MKSLLLLVLIETSRSNLISTLPKIFEATTLSEEDVKVTDRRKLKILYSNLKKSTELSSHFAPTSGDHVTYPGYENMTKTYCLQCCNSTADSPCRKGEHIMCKYKTEQPSKNCLSSVKILPILDIETNHTLFYHNAFRNQLALGRKTLPHKRDQKFGGEKLPAVSNMREMLWDEELAVLAQRWAYQCINSTDACRDSLRGWSVAQVVLDTQFMFYDVASAMGYLFSKALEFAVNPTDKSPLWNSYIHILRPETYLIGCGRTVYWKSSNEGRYILVCNYGPATFSERIFKFGKPCSACDDNTVCSKTYPGLCRDEWLHQRELEFKRKFGEMDHSITQRKQNLNDLKQSKDSSRSRSQLFFHLKSYFSIIVILNYYVSSQ